LELRRLIMHAPPHCRAVLPGSGSNVAAVSTGGAVVRKDAWLLAWIRAQAASNEGVQLVCSAAAAPCRIPKYLPPRAAADAPQAVPRAIWQSWKTAALGPTQHEASTSFINANPEVGASASC
jgi:hypothetical protein